MGFDLTMRVSFGIWLCSTVIATFAISWVAGLLVVVGGFGAATMVSAHLLGKASSK